MQPIAVIEADLETEAHRQAVLDMVNAYAMDPMGNSKPLEPEVRRNLIPGLRNHPTTLILLAYEGEEPVGIAVCFRGFSTFAARALLNIHDLSVVPSHRGRGIGRMLLESVERKAREMGCCKVTLEVLEKNENAGRLYETIGFSLAPYGAGSGASFFMAKPL